jgi:hypothetical protein
MTPRLIALAIWAAGVLGLVFAGIISRSAHAEPVLVCERIELPGKEHTPNPNDPPAKQRQETIKLCSQVEIPDKPWTGPVIDYRRDPRVFA